MPLIKKYINQLNDAITSQLQCVNFDNKKEIESFLDTLRLFLKDPKRFKIKLTSNNHQLALEKLQVLYKDSAETICEDFIKNGYYEPEKHEKNPIQNARSEYHSIIKKHIQNYIQSFEQHPAKLYKEVIEETAERKKRTFSMMKQYQKATESYKKKGASSHCIDDETQHLLDSITRAGDVSGEEFGSYYDQVEELEALERAHKRQKIS